LTGKTYTAKHTGIKRHIRQEPVADLEADIVA
jgi:hypothetical protein